MVPAQIRIAVVLLLLLAACQAVDKTAAHPGRSAAVLKDLSYGPDSLNKLDLYLPAGRSRNTPVVIFIHGGGWVRGDKSQFYSRYAEELYDKGWIVANMNYRLIGEHSDYRNIMSDVKHALEFLHKKSADYGIEQDRFTLIGHSAGGHIALLYAHHFDLLNQVQMTVSYAGPANINDLKLKTWADSVWDMPFIYPYLLGEAFRLNSKAAVDCSPVYHVKNVPTLLIYGTNDAIVPYSQALQMNDSLQARGVKHLLISIPGGDHNLHNQLNDSIVSTIGRWLNGGLDHP